MSEEATPDDIAADVLAHFERAQQAVRAQDIEAVVRCLAAALTVYEQHPSQVHAPTSQLRDLLVFIRSTRSLCNTLTRPDDDLRDLEARAEALRRPFQ